MSAEIRRLIHEQATSDTQMAGMLAAYHGSPAFFYQKAPSDSRPGWGNPRYPRVDFNIDMRSDHERKASGVLTVNIWCTTECPAVGELDPDRAIEARLLELLSGTFTREPTGGPSARNGNARTNLYSRAAAIRRTTPRRRFTV